ncbi:MAG: hypothetical protein WBW88_06920 [Rhodothermales bacterium]
MYRKKVLALPRFIAPFLALLLTTPATIHGQDLIASGAGDANSNGSYKEIATVNGKPQFESTSVSAVFIEWDGTQWILYNTATGFTNYTNLFDTPLPPDDQWEEGKASTPPTLSGPRVSYPLAGTYTVGGTSPDFATISAAVDTLNNHGITNDVRFAIRPGTYDEQVTIDAFARYGSSTDSVMFKPESGTVNWNYTGSGVANNWFIKIDGADHVTIDDIDFHVPAGTISYGTIISYGHADDLLIRNCYLSGRPNAVAETQTLVNYFATSAENVAILDNEFWNGYHGIRASGAVAIGRNIFRQQELNGILIPSSTSARIFENDVMDTIVSSTSYTGIDVTGASAEIDRNTVEIGNGDTGIEVDGSASRIRNNMVTMLDATIIAGIRVVDNPTNRVLFNSVLVVNSSLGTALYAITSTQIIVLSNILHNLGGGSAMSVLGSSVISDYNNLLTNGPSLVGGAFATLALWQAAIYGQDANSVSKSVLFTSTSSPYDLHLLGNSVGDTDLVGLLYGVVTSDIDGDTRSTLAPYMGADEATPLNTGYELTLTLNLEGPWNGSAMNSSLNSSGYLAANALQHPYGGSPWNYSGSESVAAGFFAAHPKVVDWVYVRLYSGDVSTTVVPDDDVVGFVTENGDVMSTTGGGFLTLNPSGPGDYYVAVFHRNHIPAITANPITIEFPGSTTGTLNFNSAAKYGTNPMKNLGSGRWALHACDVNADRLVTALDFTAWLSATTAGLVGYQASDCNMDGNVTALDFTQWIANTTAGVAGQIPD